jgi:protocatechuate 3,4-dioxygenase alpha subunit
MPFRATSSQTVGPFFNFGLTPDKALGRMAQDGALGERIWLSIRVTDGDGAPTPGDSMIELWQADANGRYDHPDDTRSPALDPNFRGFGRLETDENGACVFETIKPGRVPGPGPALQAPHINVSVFARGLLKQLHTRIYFAGDPANESDPALALVPPERRAALMAHPVADKANHWHFAIRLQGENETVFFDL